ncbi:MAG: hypothetical protein M3Q03_16850, partial [Chloroflexota bacterium]|nr:hypothetical protein [Chloroflexota bacterium]
MRTMVTGAQESNVDPGIGPGRVPALGELGRASDPAPLARVGGRRSRLRGLRERNLLIGGAMILAIVLTAV